MQLRGIGDFVNVVDNHAHFMKSFRLLAWLAIVLHVIGLFAALYGVRPGTAVFPVEDRMAWIQASHQRWQMAWGVWFLAALSFIAFLTAVIHRFELRGTLTNLGLAIGVAAVTVDCFNDALQIVVLPGVSGKNAFLTLAHITSVGGIIMANGLYCIAVLLITVALGKSVPMNVRFMGWAGLFTGLALSAAGFFLNPYLPEIFTGPAIGAYILWVYLLDRTAR